MEKLFALLVRFVVAVEAIASTLRERNDIVAGAGAKKPEPPPEKVVEKVVAGEDLDNGDVVKEVEEPAADAPKKRTTQKEMKALKARAEELGIEVKAKDEAKRLRDAIAEAEASQEDGTADDSPDPEPEEVDMFGDDDDIFGDAEEKEVTHDELRDKLTEFLKAGHEKKEVAAILKKTAKGSKCLSDIPDEDLAKVYAAVEEAM